MTKSAVFFAFLLSLALVSAKTERFGFETEDKNVVHLDYKNITDTTYDTPFVVLFFAPWCPHCMAFRPTYNKFADAMAEQGDIQVGDVDCTTQLYLQDLFGIMQYPTVFLFIEGMFYEYPGQRRVKDMTAWVNGGYKDQEGKPLPEVSETAAARYSTIKMFTKYAYTILIAALVLGVIGTIAYFSYFRTMALSRKGLKFQKGMKYEQIKQFAASIPCDDENAFLRPDLA
eukprot:CAMPEP_0176440546 /NCGR_PEP_ID=MMETSP0127-20121128/20634_1 /TAXON_ID=938130 /ORGANISM="Platyophrya macrostoma, Strain WH" /LENGTH=228 /DNA_ID=CAMNT_0017825089 /DNA_START=9 /DNA_END=695 /DNA_ORIENTATION=+